MSRMIKEVGRWSGRGIGPSLLWLLRLVALAGMIGAWILKMMPAKKRRRESVIALIRRPP